MRRIIRNKAGLFLKEDGTWTSDRKQAESFESVRAAVVAKHRYRLEEVDLLFQAGPEPSPQHDVIVPLVDIIP